MLRLNSIILSGLFTIGLCLTPQHKAWSSPGLDFPLSEQIETFLEAEDSPDLSDYAMSLVPPAPKGATPREQYEWNRDHYFQAIRRIQAERKEWLKGITDIDLATLKPQDLGEFEKFCLNPYVPTAHTASGKPIKMLAAAFVNFDRSQGPSAWGHVAERFVYCVGSQIRDDLFEYYALKDGIFKDIAADLKARHNIDLASYPREYLESLDKSHVMVYSVRPFERRYPHVRGTDNRTIFEVWLKAPEDRLHKMLLNNTKRFQDQIHAIKNQQPLPRYSLLFNNCTTPVAEDLEIINPAHMMKFDPLFMTPSFLYNHIQKMPIEKIVVYPSQRLFRIMKMKEQGKSTFLENFAPFSKASKGARRGGWIFYYPDSQSRFKQIMLKPVAGVLNAGSAILETAYGILTLPLQALRSVFGWDRMNPKLWGTGRIRSGVYNILWSLAEVATLRIRYPSPTSWSEEELEFLQGYEQTSVMLEYLKVKYQEAPVVIQDTETN